MRLYRFPLLLVLLSLLNACALFAEDLKTPQISLVSIKPKKIGLLKQHFELRLRVKNPNAVELPIRGLQYQLQLEDDDFAQGGSDQAITVPAYGESQFNVEVSTEVTKLLRHLQSFRHGPVNYRLSGDVGLASQVLRIPFNYEGQIKLKF